MGRGRWRITEDGRAFVRKHQQEPPGVDVIAGLAHPVTTDGTEPQQDGNASADLAGVESPKERVERAIEELHEALAAELLEVV